MESDLNNLLKTSNDAKPVEFQANLNDILGQRVAAALDRQKQEMAQRLFVPNEDSAEIENEINSDETNSSEDTDTEENDNG